MSELNQVFIEGMFVQFTQGDAGFEKWVNGLSIDQTLEYLETIMQVIDDEDLAGQYADAIRPKLAEYFENKVKGERQVMWVGGINPVVPPPLGMFSMGGYKATATGWGNRLQIKFHQRGEYRRPEDEFCLIHYN